jgi:hypothetical protein
LGSLHDEVVALITRKESDDNEIDFLPYELGIHLGPVDVFLLGGEQVWQAGWIELTISGPGYLFPWTFRDVVQRLESSPLIRKLTDVCRTTWPVAYSAVDDQTVDLRRQAGELWPYDDLRKPWDWYWGIAEG